MGMARGMFEGRICKRGPLVGRIGEVRLLLFFSIKYIANSLHGIESLENLRRKLLQKNHKGFIRKMQ